MAIAPRTTDVKSLRIASYNVNFGVAGDPLGPIAVAQAHADIIVLQESNDVWADTFARAFPNTHTKFAPPDSDFAAGGMGVISKYPIVSVTTLPHVKDGGLFYAWKIVVDVDGTQVQILNVHLRPPMSDGGSWVVGYFTTREVREHELAWHMAQLDPTLPTLIAGDFNEEGDGLAVGYAVGRGYTDAIAQFAGTRRTWEWPLNGVTLRFQLDHILYDGHFEPIAAGIVDAGRSDHMPVWADFTIHE